VILSKYSIKALQKFTHLNITFVNFCTGFSKILICGGFDPTIKACEVIDLQSSATICKDPPNLPATFWGGIGGLGLKEHPIICGGKQNDAISNRCYSLENNQWVSSFSMRSIRHTTAAAQFRDSKLVVTGGYNGLFVNTAEMLTQNGWDSSVPSLPVTIWSHCMVAVNSTTVMVIGGDQKINGLGKTFYFTFGAESWIEGPELFFERLFPSCGRIRRDKDSQEMSIIYAGGEDASIMSTVQILHAGSNEWQTGPELPFGISASQMVEDPNGGVVLIGGYSKANPNLDTLYQLPHGGQDAVWTKMEQKLKSGRRLHTAFLVPDDIVDCS
jgi:N-acetylneuraminic acid mutarotase